ncbi:hypothetical protein [Spirosoma aerolatum]|uniref:hypothetical protein n=1 Tax=Spirosoma aerolatum TaxID=1211326 RepID=UPI0009AC64CC|nr:hypothetical protein [Spirosoma aerolatum]
MKTILTDKGLILARLIAGQTLTINDRSWPNCGAWLNKWTEREIEVDYLFAISLFNLQCLQLESGNFETGERHYFFRVVTRKRHRKWRLEVTRDDESERLLPLAEAKLKYKSKAIHFKINYRYQLYQGIERDLKKGSVRPELHLARYNTARRMLKNDFLAYLVRVDNTKHEPSKLWYSFAISH